MIRQISRHQFFVPKTRGMNQDCGEAIRELTRDLDIKSVLIIGSSVTEDTAIAVRSGTTGSRQDALNLLFV